MSEQCPKRIRREKRADMCRYISSFLSFPGSVVVHTKPSLVLAEGYTYKPISVNETLNLLFNH